MNETLQQRLAHLRRRVRQVLYLYGISWVVAVVLGAVLAAGLLDWLIHLDDPGVRLILGLAILAGGCWVAWRQLVRPLVASWSDVDLALRIERRFPGFRDSFASTVQFAAAGADPRLGSPALQRAVIDRTTHAAERVDLSDVIETRPLRRIGAAAVAVCGMAVLLAGLNRAEAATALQRLLFPFAAPAWPKTNQLRLVNDALEPLAHDPDVPLRFARGETLELFVDDARGRLPRTVLLHSRIGDGEVSTERLRTTTLRDADGRPRDVAALSLTVARGPLFFRATGGDDDEMPWIEVHPVPPPVVTELQVTLTPPAYSGRPAETLPAGVGHLQALVGTEVSVTAAVNKPLRSAALRLKDGGPVPIVLNPDDETFQTTFRIEQSGVYSYWFDLQDRGGFEHADPPRYEIRAIADAEPTVAIDEPATDLTVTPTAEITLQISAKDDLGLKDVRLTFRREEAEPRAGDSIPLLSGSERPQQTTIEHVWTLAPLKLQPGERIVFHAEATDECDVGPPHVGRSIARLLTVLTPEEKTAELAGRKADLVDELEQTLGRQDRAREQVGQLQLQLENTGALRPEDLDLLKRIELDQRQIGARLADPRDGIGARSRGLLGELKSNQLDEAEMQQRLQQMADEIDLLRDENLAAAEQELTAARKAAELAADAQERDAEPPTVKAGQSLSQADRQQAAIAESLGALLGRMAEWRSRQSLSRDLKDVIKGQTELNEDSVERGRETVARSDAELTPQQRADLSRLADRQNRQAERLAQFREQLAEAAEELAETDEEAAESLRDAADELNRRATAARMREIAGQLEKNDVGQATAAQQQVLDELQELQNILQNRGASDAETLVRRLKEAEDELETLRKRQDELRQEAAEALQNPDAPDREQQLQRLRQQQEVLREEAEGMARQLRRLQSREASQSARRAAGRMQQAEAALGGEQAEQAQPHVDEALEDLEQAQRELAQQRQQAEEQLAQEMLERVADELKGMIPRQQAVVDETLRLKAEHETRGSWTRGQSKSLLNLADVERGLHGETQRLAEQIKAAEVFALALRGAARQMLRAAERLAARQADAMTIESERAALRRFTELVAALESKPQDAPADGESAPSQPSAGPPTESIPHLAQLRMLKSLQEELLARTAELDARRRDDGPLADEAQAELDALALEQGELADLARMLMQRVVKPFAVEESDEGKPEGVKPPPPDAEETSPLQPEGP